jgi:hypothetical protein
MHQHHARLKFRADSSHLRIPCEAAHIVDDFSAGLEGCAGGGGLVGVDGDDCVRAGAQDSLEHGQQTGLLFFGADRWSLRGAGCAACARAGAGALSAQVEQVRALVEKFERVGDGCFRMEKKAAVAEGVGRDVDHAHDQRAGAERERAGAQAPGGDFSSGCGHACLPILARQRNNIKWRG